MIILICWKDILFVNLMYNNEIFIFSVERVMIMETVSRQLKEKTTVTRLLVDVRTIRCVAINF
jgi:hypothetical protein